MVPEQYAYTQHAKHWAILKKSRKWQRGSVYVTIAKTEEKIISAVLTFQSGAMFWHVKPSHLDVLLQLYFLTSTCRNTPTQTQSLHLQRFSQSYVSHMEPMTHMTTKKKQAVVNTESLFVCFCQ